MERLTGMRRAVAVLAAIMFTLVGCGDDDVAVGTEGTADGPATTEPPVTERVALSESFGCAYGFHVSDPEQTVGVRIDFTGGTPATFPAVIALPDPGWDAVVVVGEELYANWCNDVIDMSQPQPRIDETWTVVAGAIEFVGEPPLADFQASAAPVTARLVGLVAERPDGSRVELGDLEVTNESWGMFAG